eukprot:GFKZ01011983.1.p1 GENE.GFKZ01011983.1~~GFKZ01011983.1.p1  ORF type:complete len:518 (+),score=92.49 GFKZ01011983.1:130-1554(+)
MCDQMLAIDTLLNSENSPVSYRHLSTHLNIPTRDAQALLLDYASSRPNIEVLWCVTTLSPTSHRCVSLTTILPESYLSKKVWAIATTGAHPLWLASDSTAALALSGAPVAQPNALRDGRFNPIKSDGSLWKSLDAAACHDPQRLPSKTKPNRDSVSPWAAQRQDKPFGGALLAEMNREQKAKGLRRSMSLKSPFTSLGSDSNTKKKVNSSACKKLGAAALAKIRAANKNDHRPSVERKVNRRLGLEGSKGRRVIEEESDDGDSDDDKEQEALRREAAERERAERDRKRLEREAEEARLEAQELAKDDDDDDEEPQSPTIRDLDEEPAAMDIDYKMSTSAKRTPEKRKLNEALGLPEVSRPQRIRKEVVETVQGEGGYMIERMVIKEFDQHGNEIKEKAPVAAGSQRADAKEKTKAFFTSSLKSKESPAMTQSGKSQPNMNKEKNARKSAAKLGASIARKASKKKINGNIWSYFK